MTLRIRLDPDNEEMIYSPLLIINYRERTKTAIATNSLASVSFNAEYEMEMTNFNKVVQGLFIGALIFTAILVIG